MRRFLIAFVAVAIFAGAGLLAAKYLPVSNTGPNTPQNKEAELINHLFAPQIKQVEMVTNRISQQFEAYLKQNDALPEQKAEQARDAIAKAETDLRDTVQKTLKDTYTLAELKEKKSFENSELAQNLAAKEQQVRNLMHSIGKELGRDAILKSVDDEFNEAQAQKLRALVNTLSTNTEMANEKRAQMLDENLDIKSEQSQMMVTLLSVSKADAVKAQKVKDYSAQNVAEEKLALAREYIKLTHLDSVFGDTVENMVDEAKMEKGYKQSRQKLAAGVAHIYSKKTLEKAVDYFSRDIAQRVLQKDMQIVQKITPKIQARMEVLNEKLSNLVQES